MRFDDSLATVLAAATDTGFGAQSAWRQLADLAGRRRVPDLDAAIARLRDLRDQVPTSVRAASARALAWGEPPQALVALFAEEELAIAAPVLRTARLDAREWLDLLARLTPATRSVLRHRRDLPAAVMRGLESFGATDFVLAHDQPALAAQPVVASVPGPIGSPEPVALSEIATPLEPMLPELPAPTQATTPFMAVGEIARSLPVVAEALRHAASPSEVAPESEIANLVARIDAFRRDRPATPLALAPTPEQWQFETDAEGIIRWVEGVARGPLIGLSLAHAGKQGVAQLNAAVGGALRARSGFKDVRLDVGGDSSAAGAWRLTGVPRFDRVTGRFTGMAGMGRRPRRHESAPPVASASDSLRQLVHELRTPTNAIAGFSELIGTELLGEVPPVYRERARTIQGEAAALVAAIDDLDTAARIEGNALDLRPAALDLRPIITRLIADMQLTAGERRAALVLEGDDTALAQVDDRAAERLIERLLTTMLMVAEPGERLRVQLANKPRTVRMHVTRPRALRTGGDDLSLTIDPEGERDRGPLLGIGFTMRLVRNLAGSLGGSLVIAPDRLTLRLPAAVTHKMERATAR